MSKPHHRAKQRHNAGYILGATLVLMLVFILSCAAFLNFTYIDAREATEKENGLHAFWTAQSGNNRTVRKLELDPVYRTAPGNYTNQLANTVFTTEIEKTFHMYTVQTVSSNYTGEHMVEELIETTPVGWHPTFSNFVAVAHSGTIQAAPTATINGTQADSGGGSPPALPALDVAYIQDLIDHANTDGGSPMSSSIDLAGNDIYINGDQSISAITGPGRLIANGRITLNANATIGPDVVLISGARMRLRSSVAASANCTLLSASNLFIGSDNQIASPSSLIAGNNLSVGFGSTINGALYAIQDMTLASNVTVSGSAVCDGNLLIAEHCFVNHDTGQFMARVPHGLEGTTEHIALRKNWTDRKIFPTIPPPPPPEEDD